MSISSFTAEDSFTVSSVNVGALIGPKGSNIKRLSRETGCHISVSARGDTVSSKLVMTLTDEQVVTVRGITTETVAAARVRIEHTTSTPRSSVSSPSSHKSVVESPRKEHPLAPSGAGVVLFDEWSDFLTSISKRNMKPTFKVHAPGCRCAKATQVHVAVSARVGSEGGAMIVLPDSKRPPLAFISSNSSGKQWAENANSCERALAACIFKEPHAAIKPAGFKLSCAACILSGTPNGCVMLVGPTQEVVATVESARVAARLQVAKADARASAAAEEPDSSSSGEKKSREPLKEKTTFESALGLHHDHAHFLLALRLDALQQAASARGRDAVQKAEKALYEAMVEAWQLQKQHEDGTRGGSSNNTFPGDLKASKSVGLEHHLQTAGRRGCFEALERANRQLKKSGKNANDNKHLGKKIVSGSVAHNMETSQLAVLVMAYADKDAWSLDLPGGKRHLGETSWECARRETWEESSVCVEVDGLWLQSSSAVSAEPMIGSQLSVRPPAPPFQLSSSSWRPVDCDHRDPPAFVRAEEVTNDGMRFFLLLPAQLAGDQSIGGASKARSEERESALVASDFEIRATVSALSRDFSTKASI